MARKRKRQKMTQSKVSSSAQKSKSNKTILPRPGRLSKLTPRSFSARDRALHALADVRRHGVSLSHAARDNDVTLRTVKRYVGAALLQNRPGERIRATKSDRLTRYLQIPTPDGPKEIKVKGSKDATALARYLSAIKDFLRGDRTALAEFRGKKISGVELITDEQILIALAEKEEFHIDSLYRSLSGGAA